MLKLIKNLAQKIKKNQNRFDDLRLVVSTTEFHLASIYKLKLEEEGIPVFVIDKRDSSYNAFGNIELYVHHKFYIRAKFLIDKGNE